MIAAKPAIRAIMVDVDGVLIAHPDPAGWSVHLERDLGIVPADLQRRFFALHWKDVIHGRARLHDRLAAVLAQMAPHVASEKLVDYWFANDANVDRGLLDELGLLRGRGVEVHLATVQEHERARYLWDGLGFREHFDGIHYSAALGCSKPDPAFFSRIEERTGFAPDELLLIDDVAANVEAARAAGWRAEQWTRDSTLRALLSGKA
jgi:putative hydrolase of the HAD superfamily